MSIVTLTKWGNSCGIRIPSHELKEAHTHSGEKFEILSDKKGGFLLRPLGNPQERWTEAFNAIADNKQQENLLGEFDNDFDKDEWTW